MPTIGVYVSEEIQRKLLMLDDPPKNDQGDPLAISQLATRLLTWFAERPDSTVRRAAVQ
jgi:hypothetical protein